MTGKKFVNQFTNTKPGGALAMTNTTTHTNAKKPKKFTLAQNAIKFASVGKNHTITTTTMVTTKNTTTATKQTSCHG